VPILGGPAEPEPEPELPILPEDEMILCENNDDDGVFYLVTPAGVIDCPDAEAVKLRAQERVADAGKVGGWVLQQWDRQLRGEERAEIKA
jgi:hypothetical protein